MRNEDVVKKFKDGATKGGSNNVFIDGQVLYSYGHHFPLLVRSNNIYISNADKYSVTTARHQAYAVHYADVSFPFSAFQGMRQTYPNLDNVYAFPDDFFNDMTVIDKTEPRQDLINYYILDADNKRKYISVNMYNSLSDEQKTGYCKNEETRPGATLFQLEKLPGKQFLASMDREQFYIVELPNKPIKTVEDAFFQLRPHYLQNNPKKEFIRQGEWFFVDITDAIQDKPSKCYRTFQQNEPLPRENGRAHTATRLSYLLHVGVGLNNTDRLSGMNAKTPLVMGTIRHQQHGITKLAKDRIYAALKNTALNSWSANGNVD